MSDLSMFSIRPNTTHSLPFSFVTLPHSITILYITVMHNGKEPYDGVIQAIQGLKLAGKKLIILSNSSKRRDNSEEMLIKRELYLWILSAWLVKLCVMPNLHFINCHENI